MLKGFGGQINVVPYIRVPEAVLVERLAGRWTCKAQGHIFHEHNNPPKETGRCDIDGSDLYQREDDKAETVHRRIQVYMQQTEPLIQYYRQHGILVDVDGSQDIDQVTAGLMEAIAGRL
jgi:adenylate kinase